MGKGRLAWSREAGRVRGLAVFPPVGPLCSFEEDCPVVKGALSGACVDGAKGKRFI